jgi:hypothetical protein
MNIWTGVKLLSNTFYSNYDKTNILIKQNIVSEKEQNSESQSFSTLSIV